jgi:hypothetical protein
VKALQCYNPISQRCVRSINAACYCNDANWQQSRDVPTVSGGVLWPDQINKVFYLYSGEYSNGSVKDFTNGLWFFDTIYNKWDRALSDGSQTRISWPAFGASAVTDEGFAWYYGGYLSSKTVPGWAGRPLMLNSLVSYDMNKRSWTNNTSEVRRAEGTLQYITAGNRGMLIYFGGLETSPTGIVSYVSALLLILIEKLITQI